MKKRLLTGITNNEKESQEQREETGTFVYCDHDHGVCVWGHYQQYDPKRSGRDRYLADIGIYAGRADRSLYDDACAGDFGGGIVGYTMMKEVCAVMYYGSYSLLTYVTVWNAQAFLLTTIVPVVIML